MATEDNEAKLSDLLPPPEIVAAAETVRVWMEQNGYRNWQLGGISAPHIPEPLE